MKKTIRHYYTALIATLLITTSSALAQTHDQPTMNPWSMPVTFETGPEGLPLPTALELLAHSVNLTPIFEGVPEVTVTYNIPGQRPFGQLWVLITSLHELDSLLIDDMIVVAPEGSLDDLKPSSEEQADTSSEEPAGENAEQAEPTVPYEHHFYALPASVDGLINALRTAFPAASATILEDADSLLVNAPADQHESISVFIDDYRTRVGLAQLDRPLPDTSPISTAYYPGGGDLEALASMLSEQYPGAGVTPLPDSNLIAVTTTANTHEKIADQIHRLNTARFNFTDHHTRAYYQINHSDPDALLESVRNALSAEHENIEQLITLDATTRTLVLTGTETFVADAQHILQHLDRQLPQVNIQVRFQEVSTRATEQLGINLANTFGLLATRLGGGGLEFLLRPASQGLTSFNIHATLDMLEQQNLSRSMQDTSMTVTSGQPGKFTSGGEINLVMPSSNESDAELVTIEYGTILEITPFVTEDGKVRLDINAGVSGFQGEVTDGFQLTTRDINTLVTAEDGQALVIAGLLENTVDVSTSGVPFLMDIPILGALFRSTTNTEMSSDVMIVVKAEVIEPGSLSASNP